jgi:hypothetical protein
MSRSDYSIPFWISDQFRAPGSGFDPNALFFTVGIDGEADGLFGEMTLAREPSSLALLGPGASPFFAARLVPFAASGKIDARIGWNPIR